MPSIRPPAVAGAFYPAAAAELRRMVHDCLDQANADTGPPPKAIIAPHAGYVYSGAVAAAAYKGLEAVRDRITRVVLLGPDHHVGFRGMALSSADAYETPLGRVTLDPAAAEQLLDLPQIRVLDAAHQQEHSLEVQLPFLQELLGEFQLVPIVVGEADTEQVEQVLARLWGGPETLIVISSDLSHFHDYDTAVGLDAATAKAIEQLRPKAIGPGDACGRNPVRGLLSLARRLGLQVTTADLRNSGDTAGPRDRVVGYGAWRFTIDETSKPSSANGSLDRRQRAQLLDIARRSIAHGLNYRYALAVPPGNYPPPLRENRATFVTLHLDGRLRGCIGTLEAHRPLVTDVAHNAYAAAFQDPRFQPVSESEHQRLDLEISVLSPATAMQFDSEADLLRQLRPGVDGLILEDAGHRGTFLPAVWEQLPKPEAFLRQLKQKAGLPPEHWSPGVKVSRYVTESFG